MWLPGTFLNQSSNTKIKVKIGQNLKIKSTVKGSKLPFMLKSTLDLLNSIWESDASWCAAAETAISNLETEHGITIKGSKGPTVWKSPPLCQFNSFKYKWLFPTLIHDSQH